MVFRLLLMLMTGLIGCSYQTVPYEPPPLAYTSGLSPVMTVHPTQLLSQPQGWGTPAPPLPPPFAWHPEQPTQPAAKAKADTFSLDHPVNKIYRGAAP